MKPNFFILKLISLPEKPKSSRGFTLTELLIAASLTLIVIGAAGFGLYQTMRGSKIGNNQAERRSEIARAYEFISDEMRRAKLIFGNNRLIDTDTTDDDNEYLNQQVTNTNAPFYDSGTTTVATDSNVVLALKIPVTNAAIDKDGNVNNEATIVYYVKDAPTGSVWKGPKILYRWGPPIDNSGQYTNGAWVSQPLIDQLKNASVASSACAAGWNLSNAPGFAACIDPQGRVAQIYLNGEIFTAEGNKDYLGKTKTAARANDQTTISLSSLDNRNYGLGGEFKCQSSGNTIAVDTTLEFYDNPSDATPASTEIIKGGGSSKRELNSTNKINVTSTPTGCAASTNPVQSVTPVSVNITFNTPAIDNATDPAHPRLNFVDPGNAQVLVLYDYKDISSYNTQYEDQKTLKEYLKSKGVEFYVEGGTETNKIKLNPHQLLLAFEIGQTSATIGSPPVANPGWDFQDNLVLLNVK
ncbi:MAG: hypothetical protein Kow0049_18880 [Stanieria sp.]